MRLDDAQTLRQVLADYITAHPELSDRSIPTCYPLTCRPWSLSSRAGTPITYDAKTYTGWCGPRRFRKSLLGLGYQTLA
jgi:hypothetical protein